LQSIDAPDIWDKNILQAKNYHQFTEWHLRELARLRFLPQDWPTDIRQLLMQLNGAQLLIISQLKTDISLAQIGALINHQDQDNSLAGEWQLATRQAASFAKKNGLSLDSFSTWTGTDLSVDFYRLWSADQLALKDIDPQRFKHYELLAQQLLVSDRQNTKKQSAKPRTIYQEKLGTLLNILVQFSGDAPSDHFLLDLKNGKIKPLP
jgi:DNA-binding transcriptional MerR regulator